MDSTIKSIKKLEALNKGGHALLQGARETK